MQRYFIHTMLHKDLLQFSITTDYHHIKNVMRFKVGDEIIVCDEHGHCFISLIQAFEGSSVVCSPLRGVQDVELPVTVDIAQALIRRERFEYMIQKSTELGVSSIIPTITKHTIVKVDGKKEQNKTDRWNAIAKEASEQSHRNHLATVQDITSLKQLPFSSYDIVLVAYEKEHGSSYLKQLLHSTYKQILVLIGPEGGFDPSEIDYLETIENVHFVGLGKRILRSETASSYILSVLSFVYEMEEDV